jgi:hypothetical protein
MVQLEHSEPSTATSLYGIIELSSSSLLFVFDSVILLLLMFHHSFPTSDH